MSSENCFLCLNKSGNKVCPTCNCFAHPKCWGKYLQNVTFSTTIVYPNVVTLSLPYKTPCPICKEDINSVKSVTRSDTKFARSKAFSMTVKDIVFMLEMADNEEERDEIAINLFKYLRKHKDILNIMPRFQKNVKNKLEYLYVYENWTKANIIHHTLFGKQLQCL